MNSVWAGFILVSGRSLAVIAYSYEQIVCQALPGT